MCLSRLQVRVHGSLWTTRLARIFCRATSGVSYPLHRRHRLRQRHGNIRGVGQWDGQNWLGQGQVEKNSGAGGTKLWGTKLRRIAVRTREVEQTGRAVNHTGTQGQRTEIDGDWKLWYEKGLEGNGIHLYFYFSLIWPFSKRRRVDVELPLEESASSICFIYRLCPKAHIPAWLDRSHVHYVHNISYKTPF